MKQLTKRQKEILKYMKDNKKLVYPTYQEVADHFNCKRENIHIHLKKAAEKGFVKMPHGKNGKLEIIKED